MKVVSQAASANTSVQVAVCQFKNATNTELAHICGAIDANLRAIETGLDVSLSRRAESFHIRGIALNVNYAQQLLQRLMHRAAEPISQETVALELVEYRNALAQTQAGSLPILPAIEAKRTTAKNKQIVELNPVAIQSTPTGVNANEKDSQPELRTRRAGLGGRTAQQRAYIANILAHDITFGVGPAGTGKTYLAVACAVDALERDLVKRIVLTRPAVEAGERLGFLPGDLAQKIDPYLRPLYDALYDLMGYDKTVKLFEKQIIEIAPLAYMRGRTLNHAFIILDEAQNTTCEQMKMFLTRTGFGSKVVITGDVSQVDLPRGTHSGLKDALHVLQGIDGIAVNAFGSVDVVRHPLVGKIVDAYEANANKLS